MNIRLVCLYLHKVCILIAVVMLVCLPFSIPGIGERTHEGMYSTNEPLRFEEDGFMALLMGIIVSGIVAVVLKVIGRNVPSDEEPFRKEAMAVVGLSWMLATFLGALPFVFAGVKYRPTIRLMGADHAPQVFQSSWAWRSTSIDLPERSDGTYMSSDQYKLLETLIADTGEQWYPISRLEEESEVTDALNKLDRLLTEQPELQGVLVTDSDPDNGGPRVRMTWVSMNLVDAMFESQSGFSTTGATVITRLEDPNLVPHCILFWRSSTHFLGGLGIIVLFVVVLGQGSAGKAFMRAEMPGPTKEGSSPRMQHTAWRFAGIYLALNFVLTIVLWFSGMTFFDGICHAFGTMATGGFSTYDSSLGHFDSATIEYIVTLFMILAGTNFTLLYLLLNRKPGALWADQEWKTYIGLIGGITLLIVVIGIPSGDFDGVASGVRYGLFQVVSVVTTTGYGTNDFDIWNSFGRGILLLLMFVGGCAGSTGGGMKVIRHVLFVKILRLEMEQAYRPTVVRPLQLGNTTIEDKSLRHNILVYFSLILSLFLVSWLFVITYEPDRTWGPEVQQNKLLDSAGAVAATLNNIGPGVGIVGPTQNYAQFTPLTKLMYTWLMMLGRLELFAVLVLFLPGFWKKH